MKINAHIVVADAAAASEWYARAFGAREQNRVPLPDGRVMTLEIVIGESIVHVASEFPAAGIVSPQTLGGTATVLQIQTDDARSLWHRAIAAGATVRHPLAEQFWGELHGQITDPFGHRWNLAQSIRSVTLAEMAAAAAALFGGGKA